MMRIPYKESPGVTASLAVIAMLTFYGVSQDTAQETAQQAITTVEQYEGYVPEAYRDPVGIWTKCFGDTTNVTPGAKYTFAECSKSLNDHFIETSAPVMRCVPDLAHQNPRVIVAMLDMAYNIGPGAFCKSSVARYANAGEWTAACKRISEIYKTAKGEPLPGLEVRRNAESELCLQGLREGK
ncbi:lysozyme [uncultured Desulfovibrio sp.]|uniref:lysozyme n=1 Tax=uncultured Desulfovibrio sp. TaxID=167968 RepID=UPI0025E8F9AB|nr:lysozyme [uncultured Desulfovibrio sp.]